MHSRLGGDALYDDVLDITWLANANLAETNTFGLATGVRLGSHPALTSGINGVIRPNGRMNISGAYHWIDAMNSSNYLGINNWRLPTLDPINGSAFNTSITNDGSTDRGKNISRPGTTNGGSTGSEMAHLFYNTLGNVSDFDTTGTFDDGCTGTNSCLTNPGLFTNLISDIYGTGLEFAGMTEFTWMLDFSNGDQDRFDEQSTFFFFAVHPGDVSAVPIPGAVWLMGSALMGLLGIGRRKRKHH